MDIKEFIKLQEQVKAFQPNPAIIELGKTLAKARLLSNSFVQPATISQLGQIAKTMEPFIINMKNYEGMSNAFVQFKDIFDAIKKNSTFLEYNIDLSKTKEEEDSSKETDVKIKQTEKLKRIITDIYKDYKNLFQLSPREFEEMIAELLFAQGFEVELTKQTRDNGYDIIALKDLKSQLPLKFLVECKRFVTQKVGVEIVRSFKDVILTEKANRGIIVTTSYFSADAKKKQKETPYLLDYRDKDKVMEWVNEYYSNQICR